MRSKNVASTILTRNVMNVSRKEFVAGWMFLLLVAFLVGEMKPTPESQKPNAGNSEESFPESCLRITFGFNDSEPKAWDGEVLPGSGQLLEVREDRFRVHNYKDTVFGRS